jgi:hypothetical protein
MSHIVLTAEQLSEIVSVNGPVEVRDDQGRVLGRVLSPSVAALVAESKRRRANRGTLYPAAEVEARLNRLAEVSRQEELSEERALELLERMRRGETV